MTHHNYHHWENAEKLNGWLAMIGFVAAIGAYANAYGVKVCKGQVKSGGKRKTAKGYTRGKR